MPSTRSFQLCACVAILALGFAIYAAGLSGYWVFDDFHNIVENSSLFEHGLDKAHFIALLTSSDAGVLHRSLSTLSFYLDGYLFGPSPWAFKLTNILIHLLAAICFAGMARSLLRLYRLARAPELDLERIDWIVIAATAVWVVHPLNLTAVLYVVQRETSLSAIFTALAIWAYAWGRHRQYQGRSALWIHWLLVPGLIVLGLAAKENAALIPAFLFIVEWILLGFRSADGRVDRRAVVFFAVFLVIPAILLTALLLKGSPILLGGYAIRDFTMFERLLTECRVIFSYLSYIAFPDLTRLGLYHDDVVVSRNLLQPLTTLPAVVGVVALLVSAVLFKRRLPWLSFGILWFFAGHLMESTVLPLELMFEHRNYVPMYGLLLGIAATVGGLSLEGARNRALALIVVLVVLLFAGLTTLRASEWRSPLAFAVYEAGHHPRSSRAQYEVGSIYSALVLNGKPELAPQAEEAMLKARALDPDSIAEDLSLAMTFATLKQDGKVHAYLMDAARRATQGIPNAETQTVLQTATAFDKDSPHLPFQDMDQLFHDVLTNPHVVANPCYAGNVANTYALFLQNNDHIPQAMTEMHGALEGCPGLIYTRINYAYDLVFYRDVRDAREQMKLIEAANVLGQYTVYLEQLKKMIAEVEKPK
ncbi:MAG TPA: hypothetical protein VGH91_08095 [Gammaproteobacteria bacterium]|jgi:hypothetical protein